LHHRRAAAGQQDRGVVVAHAERIEQSRANRVLQIVELRLAMADIRTVQRLTHARADVDWTRIQQDRFHSLAALTPSTTLRKRAVSSGGVGSTRPIPG